MLTINFTIILVTCCLQSHPVNACFQSQRRAFRLQQTRLRDGSMDDQSFKNMGIDFLSPNASILNYQDTGNVHIGGLFESLSPLPVYEWAENDDSDWMDFGNICREDECEVSVLYLR